MSTFKSGTAQEWVYHTLYYLEQAERLAESLPETAFDQRVEGGTRASRTVGELLQEIGMTVCFMIGSTVEIAPALTNTVTKDEVQTHLTKARQSLFAWGSSLEEAAVQRSRDTAIRPKASTHVEQMVVLIGQVNRLLGQTLLIARLHGHMFEFGNLSKHPLPYAPGSDEPGLDGPWLSR